MNINILKAVLPMTGHIKSGNSITKKLIILFFTFGFITTGCFVVKSIKDIDKTMESTAVVGQVYTKTPEKGRIIVAAYSTSSEENKKNYYTVIHEAGEYEIMVQQGNYIIFAFLDKNSNLIYEKGERAGQYGNPQIVNIPEVGVVDGINITIPDKDNKIEVPLGTEISKKKPAKLYSRQAGDITTLDDERFLRKNAKKGFWEPGSFFKKYGGSIFFLEKYNPDKIPVLFIHGAIGTPKDWRYFIDNLDTTRFQPWFFYYPSGSRLSSISNLLYWKLSNLQAKYKFNELFITAHSMGGLIARSFIINNNSRIPYVSLFITLATPWGGDSMAEYGVDQSPLVIPSWVDMQPNSEFINSLYKIKLPESVSFYQFYGYKGGLNILQSNDDGTIDLSSLLDFRSQSEAKMSYAFNESHGSILSSKEAMTQYNIILKEFDEKYNLSQKQARGYLKINFSYEYNFSGVRPNPLLILTPVDRSIPEIATSLREEDNSRDLGPFPVGDYIVSMITDAGKPDKKYVPVTIDSSKVSELEFVFSAAGDIRGYIVPRVEAEERFIGMPEYIYHSDDKKIVIESIILKGNGIERKPKPVRGEQISGNNAAISREDYCYNEFFSFWGLSAGEYTLIIKAKGYKTIIKNIPVIPGVPRIYRITELEPE